MLTQVALMDGKLCQPQVETGKLKEQLEADEIARPKAVKDAEDAGSESLPLSELEISLRSQLAREQKRVADAEPRVAVVVAEVELLKAEVVKLKKENEGLVTDAKDAILATEETLKAQVRVLGPDVDVSVMGAFRTAKDGEIVDLE
ncbi:hypothetical protein AHAS_Ahas11G0164400 [Arachis hypogaea]